MDVYLTFSTNRVNRVKKMSRKIPTAIKELALRLWLQGYAYREIRDRAKMSLGAINQMVADVRGETPDVDRLRELNVILGKGSSNVYDAMRGGMLLSELNRLGVGLGELEGFIKLSARMSSSVRVSGKNFNLINTQFVFWNAVRVER